jgi:tol-pal system protein YbgF
MKKKIAPQIATLLALLAFAPLLTQCASQGDVNKMNYQLRVVNKKLEDMKMGTVDQMQQRQASSLSQIDELHNEVLKLRGQLDEMAHFNRQLSEQSKELELSLQQYTTNVKAEIEKERKQFQAQDQLKDAKLNQLEERFSQQQGILKSIQESRTRDAQAKAEAAALAAEKARARANASKTVLADSNNKEILSIPAEKKKTVHSKGDAAPGNSAPNSAPKQTEQPAGTKSTASQSSPNPIESADQAFAAGDYKKAYDLYEAYSRQQKSGDQAVTANFMMGESLFQQKEYDQAILQYQKIISNHPTHARAASALLKQGVAFENLADFETAKIIYKKIVTSYPSSPEAAKAKERSAKLK